MGARGQRESALVLISVYKNGRQWEYARFGSEVPERLGDVMGGGFGLPDVTLLARAEPPADIVAKATRLQESREKLIAKRKAASEARERRRR